LQDCCRNGFKNGVFKRKCGRNVGGQAKKGTVTRNIIEEMILINDGKLKETIIKLNEYIKKSQH